jgi:hypothetical protein
MSNVHIKLEYEDAVNSKRNILQVQENLLKSILHLKKYNSLRKVEFSLKNKIRKDFFELNKILVSLQENFPKEEAVMPKEFSKNSDNKKNIEVIKTNVSKIAKQSKASEKKLTIESELEEIRNKLARLN